MPSPPRSRPARSRPKVGPTLLWFRQDLRLQDNPALDAAVRRGAPIISIYILDDAGEGKWPLGGASRWWLHHSLAALQESLALLGSRLIFFRGATDEVMQRLLTEWRPGAVLWNRRYEPAACAMETKIAALLAGAGVATESFNSALLREPGEVTNREGNPFRVFSPYWRTCLALPVSKPLRFTARTLLAPRRWPRGEPLVRLELLPRISWDAGLIESWKPGEAQGLAQLRRFARQGVNDYDRERNRPDRDGTSSFSPWLHFGEISPRQVWAAMRSRSRTSGVFPANKGTQIFLNEIGWREFAYHLLYHFPATAEKPLRAEFEKFSWAQDPGGEKLRAWQRGRTGYPVVDAGMRQLWHTGWMHNRVRMVVASFLVKHLRLPWQLGAAWFWNTLVDADLASNSLNWQWSAGSGADAAPYFRIFAPVLQGEKFDSEGLYVRKWIPELRDFRGENVHAPWETSSNAEDESKSVYPPPIVEHKAARNAALAAWREFRDQNRKKN